MNFIVAYLACPSRTQGGAGGLALIMFASLLVALGAYALGRHIWRCPYRAVLIAAPTFVGMVYLLLEILERFAITI